MATPTKKSPQMETALNSFSRNVFGRERSSCIVQDICVCCGKEAKVFRDDLSRKEYLISGMCQNCQDSIWGKK